MRTTVTNTATLFSGFNTKIFAFVLAGIALSSCHKKRLHEKAVVVEKHYSKGTFEGWFVVLFRCEHNTAFAKDDVSLYGRLNTGDSVILDYYESQDDNDKIVHESVEATPIKKAR